MSNGWEPARSGRGEAGARTDHGGDQRGTRRAERTGYGLGEASAGRGFSDLALSGLQQGHAGLTAEFETYCKRWEWGVRALTLRGNNFAIGVGLAAGSVHEQDQQDEYVEDSFKVVVNGVTGNPHLTEDQVKKKS